MLKHRCGRLAGRVSGKRVGQFSLDFFRPHKWRGWRVGVIRKLSADGTKVLAVEDVSWSHEMERITAVAQTQKLRHLEDEDGLEKFPRLSSFLADCWYGDPKTKDEREPGSIYLCPRGGVLAVTLKEPSQRLLMRLEVRSLKVLFQTIEASLDPKSGSLWETDPWSRSKPKKGKK